MSTPHLATKFREKTLLNKSHLIKVTSAPPKKNTSPEKNVVFFCLCQPILECKGKGVQPSLGIQNMSFSFVLPKIDIKHKFWHVVQYLILTQGWRLRFSHEDWKYRTTLASSIGICVELLDPDTVLHQIQDVWCEKNQQNHSFQIKSVCIKSCSNPQKSWKSWESTQCHAASLRIWKHFQAFQKPATVPWK